MIEQTPAKTEPPKPAASTPSCDGHLPAELARPFRLIAFDWDGTAVANRGEDATGVCLLLQRLLHLRIFIVIITGTNFNNVNGQLSAFMHGPHKRRLYVATNRGSEVYGFDALSRPRLVFRRRASSGEDQILTEIADAVRDELKLKTGLDIRVIYDRLNRRKIDLIPDWPDPPKSSLAELLRRVEERLKGAGLTGGLHAAFELAEKVALDKGLKDARITSDVKHIEVGLTDKSDAINWVVGDLGRKEKITPDQMLIGGDEFGPIAGFAGSDARMFTSAAKGAVFVSVGPEPEGAPEGIIHVEGGPECFKRILALQIEVHERRERLRRDQITCLPAAQILDPDWLLVAPGFNPAREHETESLFALSNGYVGTRGSVVESTRESSPGTFVAGVFDMGADNVPGLVVAPDWVTVHLSVNGEPLSIDEGEVLEHRRVLDMSKGIFFRSWRHRSHSGRVSRLYGLRLASLADRHVLLQSLTFVAENYSQGILLESVIGIPEQKEWERPVRTNLICAPPSAKPVQAVVPTDQVSLVSLGCPGTKAILAFAAKEDMCDGNGNAIAQEIEIAETSVVERAHWEAKIGDYYLFDRLVAVYTSVDSNEPGEAATEHVRAVAHKGVETLVAEHVAVWESRWKDSSIEVEGDAEALRALRFACYHLISVANPENERISVGARGLTGEAYRGHVFWDTDIFMLPFYIYTCPRCARALLMYRFYSLAGAREKAQSMGYRGALFPWESANPGEETTPNFAIDPDGVAVEVLSGKEEHHISADVAYAVWHYWQATGDDDFFVHAGAEILLETARFWASRVNLWEDGLYHINHVIGPDEYHESVDDNAYTNLMAQWNLEQGVETVRILQQRWPEHWRDLSEKMHLGFEERQEWIEISQKMYTGFNPKTGLIEQFRGYFGLEEIDLSDYASRRVPMDVLLGRDRIARSKVVKQADVLMAIYLLWDRFPAKVREANFRYYEPRTGHGSSLSPSIHAAVAARLGDEKLAEHYFHVAEEIDLSNEMGNAAGGVHFAALGGLWQAAVMGVGGMHIHEDALVFEPHLIEDWETLIFAAQWHGQKVDVIMGKGPVTIEVIPRDGANLKVEINGGPSVQAREGYRYVVKESQTGWEAWREEIDESCSAPHTREDGR